MTLSGGGWGYGKWGTTLVWGYQLSGVAATANVLTQEFIDHMAQTTPEMMLPEIAVTIDGTDVTSSMVSATITLQGNITSSTAELTLSASSLSATAHQSVASVSVTYTMPGGDVFTGERFRGIIHKIENNSDRNSNEYVLTCYDQGFALSENPPITVGTARGLVWPYGEGTTALDYIQAELSYYGLSAAFGDFDDYTPIAFYPQQYPSSLAMIADLVTGQKESIIFFEPNGMARIRNYDATPTSPFALPLTCQSQQSPIADDDRYNRIVLTYPTYTFPVVTSGDFFWSVGGVAYGFPTQTSDTYTYTDAALVSSQGLLESNESISMRQFGATVAARAASMVANSQLQKYQISTPINPYLFPGETLVLTLTDSTTANIRVEKCTDVMSWEGNGGFWSTLEGRVSG